ncbi:MAG: hypothetical protein AAFO69_06700, partial [Bacteroidota bacterium]
MKQSLLFILILSFFSSLGQEFRSVEVQAKLADLDNINGIAVADIDGDYDLDFFAVIRRANGRNNESRLFRNNNDGTFTDITTTSGIHSAFDYGNF